MDGSWEKTLDQFQEFFNPCDNLRYLEVWNFEDPAKDIYRQGSLNRSNLTACLRRQEEYNERAIEGLRIIFSERLAAYRDHDHSRAELSHPPLRMRQDTFVAITKAFSLPLSYMKMLREGSTVFLDVPNSLGSLNVDIENFLFQNSFTSTSQFSVALSYDSRRCLTSALVHSMSESQINTLINDVIEHRENIALPMLLPTLLLAPRVSSATTKVRDCHQRITGIEYETGIRTNWHPNHKCCSVRQSQSAGVNRYDSINFDRVTGDLTSLSSKLAYCKYVCEVHLPMLDHFDRINSRLLEDASADNKCRLKGAEIRLRVENNFLRSTLQGTLVRTQYLSQRSKAQVQTIYSLIAQKDNALNIRDNAALKAISEDQKRIALAATRDSAAMRVISAITTVFLPATFTAAFFSTTFFNFQAGADGHIVSTWLWLYFVVTVILSTFTLTWWYVISRRQVHRVDDIFGAGRQEKEM